MTPTPSDPILIFDSGVGGLTVLREVRARMPDMPLVYAADRAGFPYGTKSEAEIAARVPALLGRLVERFHPRLAVIACNTASTIALPAVRAALDLPIVGTVPAIKPAAAISKTRVIGVLGTQATVRQPYVDRLAAEFASDCTIVRHGAPELVELAEAKLRGEPTEIGAVAAAIAPMFAAPAGDAIDVLVLACTHFPLLSDEIAAAAPQRVTLIDGSAGIARRCEVLNADRPTARLGPDRAVFTGMEAVSPTLAAALRSFGLERIETL